MTISFKAEFDHTVFSTAIDFGAGISTALQAQAIQNGETPPTQLEIDEWRTGLGGPLLPLTPLPDSSPCATPASPSHPHTIDTALRQASAILERSVHTTPINASDALPRPSEKYRKTPNDARKAAIRESKKNRKKRARQKNKERREIIHDAFLYKVRPGLSRKFQTLQVLKCDVDVGDLPACEGAWKGKYEREGKRCMTLSEALGMGLKLHRWDGR